MGSSKGEDFTVGLDFSSGVEPGVGCSTGRPLARPVSCSPQHIRVPEQLLTSIARTINEVENQVMT